MSLFSHRQKAGFLMTAAQLHVTLFSLIKQTFSIYLNDTIVMCLKNNIFLQGLDIKDFLFLELWTLLLVPCQQAIYNELRKMVYGPRFDGKYCHSPLTT